MNTQSQNHTHIQKTIKGFRAFLNEETGRQTHLQKSIDRNETRLQRLEKDLEDSKKAQEVINIVAKATQEELQYHLSDLVSLAMSGIFPDPYGLKVEFTPRRGKVEADMNFEKNGNLVDPLSATGGGTVDVGGLSLRFSCWAIGSPRTRPVLILDEPLKWLKGNDLPMKGSQMIQEISKKLGLQIIMVSHDPELIEGADKIISVSIKNGVSRIV